MGITLWQGLCNRAEAMAHEAFKGIRSLDDWQRVHPERQREFLRALGLDPLPPRCDPKVTEYGEFDGPGYRARRVAFQMLPDCWSSAHIYYPDPLPARPAPAVLYVCGHGSIGTYHYQYHPMMWARRGYICLIVDTVEQHDNPGEHHGSLMGRFDRWVSLGYTPAGAEVWNAMRAMDVLCADPRVDPERIGITGVSGGGACSFHAAAADERFKAVSTLCGISSPFDAIVNRHLYGHCDCMYPHNLHGRDISEYAALIAPRAGLFCFTEQDPLYHVEECRALVDRARCVWRLHGQEERCRTVTCPGPHGDNPVFDEATAEWFDRYLAGEGRPPVKRGTRELPESALSVFNGRSPAPNQLAVLPELLSLRGTVPLPKDSAEWPHIHHEAISALLDAAPSLRSSGVESSLRLDGRWCWGNGSELTAYRGRIEEQDVWLQYVMPAGGRPNLVLSIAGEGENAQHALARAGNSVDPAITAYGSFEPRVAGHNSLSPSTLPLPPGSQLPPTRTMVQRAMALTGATPVAMTVQDLSVVVEYLLGIEELRTCRLYLLACGDMAAAALHCALQEERIAGLILKELPSSHLDGAPVLNVLRALDTPHAVGLMAPRKVALVDAGHSFWTWPARVYERLGCPNRLVLAGSLREGVEKILV